LWASDSSTIYKSKFLSIKFFNFIFLMHFFKVKKEKEKEEEDGKPENKKGFFIPLFFK
jgi:hypothetical protein